MRTRIERVAQRLGLRGYARIDAFVERRSGRVMVIEANTLPALTPSTVLFHQGLAESPPIMPRELLELLIEQSYAQCMIRSLFGNQQGGRIAPSPHGRGDRYHVQSWTAPCGRGYGRETHHIKRQRAGSATCSGGGLPRDTPLEEALWLRVYCKGKVAIVTGAGSPIGIGHAITLGLIRAGARVAMLDIIRHGSSRARTRCERLGRGLRPAHHG